MLAHLMGATMNKIFISIILATLAITSFSIPFVFAHQQVVVVPIGGSASKITTNDNPCTSQLAGTLRWTGSTVEVCDGTYWSRLSIVAPVPTVFSANGREWMDRNLGASRVATSSTDNQAYGDLYQWGRLADGHEKRTSGTVLNQLSSSDNPGHDRFILATEVPYDWRSPYNPELWHGVSGINNPCPSGFRLPTRAEWEAEMNSWSSKDADGAFSSPLKLTVAGNRNYSNGNFEYVGDTGRYWTSQTYQPDWQSRIVQFSSSSGYMNYLNRARGLSIRCIKD